MMSERLQQRLSRKKRVRKKLKGTPQCPRLAVYRSAGHIYAQIIDDTIGQTLVSIDDRNDGVQNILPTVENHKGKIAKSFATGKTLAKIALDAGIKRVAFDRGGYLYHGRVKALADGARDGGLQF